MIRERIEKISDLLENNEAALITSGVNRLYLSGFNSSAGAVLVTKHKSYLFEDFRYFEKASKTVKELEVIFTNKLYSQITDILNGFGVKSIMIESESVTLKEFSAINKNLPDFNISASDELSNALNDMRAVKTVDEIENIKKAQKLTDDTFSYILNFIKAGKTETEIALLMEFYMRKSGSEGASFDFIVVSGKNSSLPHGVPTDKPIEKGDLVTMDFGAVVNGYHSDMTRTVAVGNVTDEQEKVYKTVLKAQEESLKAIKAGAVCKDIDKIARDIIDSAGYKNCFGHGLGHSVGLEIHESPCLNTRDETRLKSGIIMTVEPGIYLADEFGVRIEDMVYVTDNGYDNLTASTKDLIIL